MNGISVNSAKCRRIRRRPLPYISHLLGVASVALEFGADEDEAIAALLHDALEDGPKNLTPELDQRAAVQKHLEAEIERKFGVVVAEACQRSH